MNILVTSAHPDDMETGCGGLLLKLADDGHRITSVIFVDAGHAGESMVAHGFLGVKPIIFEFFNNELNSVPFLHKRMEQIIADLFKDQKTKPDVIFTHHGDDHHDDHRMVHSTTFGPAFRKGVEVDFFKFEVCSGVGRPQCYNFHPTHYFELSTSLLDKKREMVNSYVNRPDINDIWLGALEMNEQRG